MVYYKAIVQLLAGQIIRSMDLNRETRINCLLLNGQFFLIFYSKLQRTLQIFKFNHNIFLSLLNFTFLSFLRSLVQQWIYYGKGQVSVSEYEITINEFKIN